MTETYTVTETFVVPDRRRLLKVKIKSLASEARIIRREENRLATRRGALPVVVKYFLDGLNVSYNPNPKMRRYDAVDVAYSLVGPNNVQRMTISEWRALKKSKKRAKGPLWHELHGHRIGELRKEQRSALIAYGFIRGMHYEDIEVNPNFRPDWNRVKRLVEKYGYKQTTNVSYDEYLLLKQAQFENFANWQQRADERYDQQKLIMDGVTPAVAR